jgi:hypothetical protein
VGPAKTHTDVPLHAMGMIMQCCRSAAFVSELQRIIDLAFSYLRFQKDIDTLSYINLQNFTWRLR